MAEEAREPRAARPGLVAVLVALIAALAQVAVEIHGSAQKAREIALLERRQQLEADALKAALREKDDELRGLRASAERAAAGAQKASPTGEPATQGIRHDRAQVRAKARGTETDTGSVRVALGRHDGSEDIYERPIGGEKR